MLNSPPRMNIVIGGTDCVLYSWWHTQSENNVRFVPPISTPLDQLINNPHKLPSFVDTLTMSPVCSPFFVILIFKYFLTKIQMSFLELATLNESRVALNTWAFDI